MSRILLVLLLIFAAASSARAHFVFVVPEPTGGVAYVILSEDLDPDEDVAIGMIGGIKLYARGTNGSVSPLTLLDDEFAYRVEFSEEESRLLFGALQLGVHQVGDKPGNLVSYFPKAILGDDVFADDTRLGDATPVELVPVGQLGDLRFQMLLRGEPLQGSEVTVYLPDGGRTLVVTDEQGLTESFSQTGRYGAWARATIGGAGEHEGRAYEESRAYASVVAQVGERQRASVAMTAHVAPAPVEAPADSAAPANNMAIRSFLSLPQATSSFGAVEAGGYMYVYGGHIARTHDYDTEAVSGRFSRIDLDAGGVWENLPAGPRLQGLNLAAHGEMVYRVGGMQPRNSRGTQRDNYSVADCARFNPHSMQWEWLAPIPEARSSHDMVVVDDTLYVIGGWNMLGEIEGNVWPDHMYTLDLSDPLAPWRRVAQPFARRALITAVHEGRIYVMGGMDDEDEVSREVDIYDPRTGQWSRGPELLGEMSFAGFASAACELDGQLYASVAGGEVMRLTSDGSAWEMVGTHTPRIVHRLVPWRGEIFVVGGAAKGTNSDLVEVLTPSGMRVSANTPRVRSTAPAAKSVARRTRMPANLDTAVARVEREPAKAVVASAPVAVAAAPAVGTKQVFCPVMTKVEVLDDDEAIAVDFNGQEVLLCCSKCAKKWEADQAAYLSPEVLPQLASMELPARTISQTYCPVYPTRVVSENDPFVMYEGKKVYLFNKTAVRRFTQSPEKYLDPTILPQLAD
ncbi:MAG: hypothetical protein DHS20C15_31960 [Planctomycetota bacterium]|nr:MAG: hypothetical protein DHS20C15_31960 [Planctomycetota bacterium]